MSNQQDNDPRTLTIEQAVDEVGCGFDSSGVATNTLLLLILRELRLARQEREEKDVLTIADLEQVLRFLRDPSAMRIGDRENHPATTAWDKVDKQELRAGIRKAAQEPDAAESRTVIGVPEDNQ